MSEYDDDYEYYDECYDDYDYYDDYYDYYDDYYDYDDYYEQDEPITRWQRVKAWFTHLYWKMRYKLQLKPHDDIPF